jgi:hypothetical protein
MGTKKDDLLDKVIPLEAAEADQDVMVLEGLKSGSTVMSKAVDAAKKLIAKSDPNPPEQNTFSFLPTTLTRISPFFPMSRRELKKHPFKAGMTWDNGWGRITVKTGNECLSVSDETTLLSVLEIAKKAKSDILEISMYQLCKVTNPKPNKLSYKTQWGNLERLMGTVFKLEILKKDKKGKTKKLVKEMIGNVLTFAERDHETNKLTIVLNTYFLKMFDEGFRTNINLKLRASLKGDVSKALYRFFQSHSSYYYNCHFLTLAKAINMNSDLPNKEIRRQLRKALAELRKAGYLKRWTMPKDSVTVYKSAKPTRQD